MMALGIFDAMAGFFAGAVFAILVIATGNVGDLKTLLTLAGIILLSYSAGILAGVFRPLRRTVDSSRARWERASDYILASILSGWVVKQIVMGLSGLSGLQLPITSDANKIGLIAGVLVATRFFGEDLVKHLYPSRLQNLEPEYRERRSTQKVTSLAMQVLVFALVAQPFIGWRIELWFGIAIFSVPLLLGLFSSHFPKSKILDRWIPIGVIEILVMTVSGFTLANILKSYSLTPERYVLIAFVLLSIPGLILKVLPLFASGDEARWKTSKRGFFVYRVLGCVALGALIYIVFNGY
jgi:hypothetical protein